MKYKFQFPLFKTMSRSCPICFTDNTAYIKCGKDCKESVCHDCMTSYIDVCSRDYNALPKCPTCKCDYFYEDLGPFCESYGSLAFNLLKNTVDITIETDMSKQMIELLTQQRKDFIRERFPVCIDTVINVVFATQLRKVVKENQKNKKRDNIRKCPNDFCYRGSLEYLEGCLKCNACTAMFCNDCDQKIATNKVHVCNKEDIETKNLIMGMIKCPSCKIPILKSAGCNHMTCSNCGTNFDYASGKEGGCGNSHNEEIKLKKDNAYLLSNMYPQFAEKLRNIEELEPKLPDIAPVRKHLANMIASHESSDIVKLLRLYSLYRKHTMHFNDYFIKLGELRKKGKELTMEYIDSVFT